jgi:hypothetical protein
VCELLKVLKRLHRTFFVVNCPTLDFICGEMLVEYKFRLRVTESSRSRKKTVNLLRVIICNERSLNAPNWKIQIFQELGAKSMKNTETAKLVVLASISSVVRNLGCNIRRA